LKSVVELVENRVKLKYVFLATKDKHDNSLLKGRNSDPLEITFNIEDRNNLKAFIAKIFYSYGCSDTLSRSPYYVNSYLFGTNHIHSGFICLGTMH